MSITLEEEFDELCEPYLTKTSGPGGPPPMIQYKRFALDLQRYADQVLTDDDITKAQELRGYVNPGDLVRNDGFFEARPDEKGKDMSPDNRRLKKHQSAQALATGIWEYEVSALGLNSECALVSPNGPSTSMWECGLRGILLHAAVAPAGRRRSRPRRRRPLR